MQSFLYRNTANILVFLRILFVLLSISLLNIAHMQARRLGILLLILAALFDWVDGYMARRMKITSDLGGLLDTLGDRIMENALMLFFVYKQLIPLTAGVLFITRAFIADFIRTLNFKLGIGTFKINRSLWGKVLVASPLSRLIYLMLKIALFLACAFVLFEETEGIHSPVYICDPLKELIVYLSWLVVSIACIRFILLVYDSRANIRKYL